MHSCAQTQPDRHRNTLRRRYKQGNPPTRTDSFAFEFWDPVLDPVSNAFHQHVDDFPQWSVDNKYTSPMSPHMKPASVQTASQYCELCRTAPLTHPPHTHTHTHARPLSQRSCHTPERSSKAPLTHASKCPQKAVASKVRMDLLRSGTYHA